MTHRVQETDALPRPFGRFVLLERIGTGGMAEVYRAKLPGLAGFEKTVVVKRLRPKLLGDETIRSLFVEEAKLGARICHRNVVQVFDLDAIDGGEPFICMEYVPGRDLRQVLEHAGRAERPVPVWLAAYLVAELLDALAFVHSMEDDGRPLGLVHCDVTPENVLVSSAGDVKLGDFGVATFCARSKELPEPVRGKLPYMSPEQVMEQPVDARTDVHAAGVLLWETLTGRRLFPGRTPSEVMAQICASPRPAPSRYAAGIPESLDQTVLEALDPQAERRIGSALEFRARLLEVIAHLRPRMTVEDVREALSSLLSAPAVREDPGFEGTQEDDDDELDALDRWAEARHASAAEAPRQAPIPRAPSNQSTPPPGGVRRPLDPRSLTPTHPRLPQAASETDALFAAYLSEEATSAAVRPGAAPAWLRTSTGAVEGPKSVGDALDWLAQDHRAGCLSTEISVDRSEWRDPSAVARLLGEAPLSLQPKRSAWSGRLEDTGFVGVIGSLGRAARGGVLSVWRDGPGEKEHLEVHLVAGTLTHVRWSGGPFDVWATMLREGAAVGGIPEAVAKALATGGSAALLLSPGELERLASTRQQLSRRRFEAAVRWTRGGFAFDPSAPAQVTERSQPVLRLLPGMVYCALRTEEIERHLAGRLNRRHRLHPDFAGLFESLGLTEEEAGNLAALGSGAPLGAAVRGCPGVADRKFVWAVAYTLVALGLLTEATVESRR